MKQLGLLLITLLALPTVGLAQRTEIFAVQIGTYAKFADDTRQSVKHFDDVHVFTYKNKSRVTVGEFTSRDNAKALLKELKNAGFQDAFIRRTGYVDLAKSQSTIEKFNILISELDARAFYLDGDMFIFQGSGYIKIHHQNLDKISSTKPSINLNPNNNFQLLNSY
jgi:cell division septation protein DedD